MTLEWIAEQLATRAMAQVVLLLLGCIASGFAAKYPTHRGLARFGVAAPILALLITAVQVDHWHLRFLEIFDLLPTSSLVPRDQKSTVAASEISSAPLVIGRLVAVILPVATWVWARTELPNRDQRSLRGLIVAGVGVLSFALWVASRWAREFIFETGFLNPTCAMHGWPGADQSFGSLDRLRDACTIAGAIFGLAASAYAISATRRGVAAGHRPWLAALALLGLGIAAKSWTAGERQDAVAYFHAQPRGHDGFEWLHGEVDDPFVGPQLEHCRFDWDSGDLVDISARRPDESIVRDVAFVDVCWEPGGIVALLAEPDIPMSRIDLALRTAEAEQIHRLGLASLRPNVISPATIGEFVQLRSCVVEFRLDPTGIPIERFSSFAELANAVDAADGRLVISLGPEPGIRESP